MVVVTMVDVHTKEQRSYNMSMVKSKDTKPELLLRKYIYSKGLRGYRVNLKFPGKPDIVFTKFRVAIFVDGCFWHKCPLCFSMPKSNIEFWEEKINKNVERDRKVNKELLDMGYQVIRFWEHEILKNLDECYLVILKALQKRGLNIQNRTAGGK